MADELNLDAVDAATSEAEIQEQLAKLKQQQGPATPPEGIDDVVPGAEPAEAEVKVEEPEKKEEPVKAAPTEQEMREGTLRRLLREKERELEALRASQQKPVERPAENKQPTFDDDPAEYLRRTTETTAERLARLEAEAQQARLLDGIRSQESAFEQQNPDYRQAVAHLEQSEVKEWEASGIAAAQINQLKNVVNAGRAGNQQAKPYADFIEQAKRRADIIEHADKTNQAVEDVAMYVAARDTWLQNRRAQLYQAAEATGRPVPQIAYELAKGRGWLGTKQETPAQPNPAAEQQARDRVLRAKEVSNAANSLSETNGDSPRERMVIKSRAQLLNMDDASLDEIIASGAYKNL